MLGSRFEHKSKSVLVAAFVIILMLMMLVVGLSYNRMSNNYQQLSSGFEKDYQLINHLIRLRQIAHERIVTTLLIVDEPDEINRFEKIEYFSELASRFLLIVDQIEASAISLRQKQAFHEAMQGFSERSAMLNEAVYLVEDDQIADARFLIHSQTRTLQAGLTQAIDELIETFRSDIQLLFRNSKDKNRITMMFTLVLVAISLAVAAFVAAYVVRYINKTEKDLRMEKENALITLQSIEDGVIRTDAGNRIIYMNPSAESILGKSTASCAGMPVCDVINVYDGTTDAAFVRPLQNNGCMSGSDGQGRDMYLLHSSGEKIWVENSVTPITTEEGAVAGNVLVIHDISENHNFKEQLLAVNRDLAELNTTLETRVHVRTSELEQTNLELQQTISTLSETQDQLIHSEKMASLGGLVAGISHEINTPLGIAVTSASSLHEETQNIVHKFGNNSLKRSEMDAFLQHSGQASEILLQNLSRASNMIRSFKQVAVDQSSEDWRTIELKSYVDEILMSLRPRLKHRKISIKNLCQSNLVLFTNPGAIYQIISNFVMNSLTHAYDNPAEAGLISISARQEKGMVIMEYSDDGSGVSAEICKKIFEPFFTTRRGRGGSGLGLNIVYNLINTTLNGKVEVSSEPGKGTRFTAVFPALYERDAS